MPKYISPSSLSLWESNRTEFYIRYLTANRRPRAPQEDYMAMGSAFDAFVKSAIHTAVYGEAATKGSQFDFEKLFETQVEPHIRDTVLERSRDLWEQYNESGSYGYLLADIIASPYEPQMEFTVAESVQGVPLSGKPDLRYVTASHIHVLADFKVNGSMSKTGASPVQGYKIARNNYDLKKPTETHKKYVPLDFRGLEINAGYLDEFSPDWADQLAIYSWTLGEPVGSEEFVTRMEQVACRPVLTRPLPRAKFATHMARISSRYQEQLMHRIHDCWNTLQSGHIFTDMSREDSDARCELLDQNIEMPAALMNPVLAGYANETTRFKG